MVYFDDKFTKAVPGEFHSRLPGRLCVFPHLRGNQLLWGRHGAELMTFIIALITGSHARKGSVLGSNNMTSMQLILENIAMATGHLGLVRHTHTHTHTLTHTDTHTHIHIHSNSHTHRHTHIHTLTHTLTHTHIHIYIHLNAKGLKEYETFISEFLCGFHIVLQNLSWGCLKHSGIHR